MRAFVTPEEMKRLDQETMKQKSLTSWDLMQEVSKEMAEVLRVRFPKSTRFLFLVGPGNNGGDGYCVAQNLSAEYEVDILVLNEPSSEEAKRASSECRVKRVESFHPENYEVVVDALYGNFSRDVLEDKVASIFHLVNRSRLTRVALDVPSGIHTESGDVHPEAFVADLTLCVAYPRESFVQEKVAAHLGELMYVGKAFAKPHSPRLFQIENEAFPFFPKARNAHKQGRVAVLAGSARSPGAAFLCAEAAQRVGAGYVELFFEERKPLEISFANASFQFAESREALQEREYEAWVMGPGGVPKNWRALLPEDAPEIWDAEALVEARDPALSPKRHRLLTPHPGEAARLLNGRIEDIKAKPIEALAELVSLTKSSVYLKGAPGLLRFYGDEISYVNLSSAPVLATAGSGDVLSGILGGLIAQKKISFEGAVFAALGFQRKLAEILKETPAALATDQLHTFSQTLKELSCERV